VLHEVGVGARGGGGGGAARGGGGGFCFVGGVTVKGG
jgi:hypothetical protein